MELESIGWFVYFRSVGSKERDRFVLQTCKDLSIPVMCSMGGGYSPDIKIIIDAHANTFRLAQEIFF